MSRPGTVENAPVTSEPEPYPALTPAPSRVEGDDRYG